MGDSLSHLDDLLFLSDPEQMLRSNVDLCSDSNDMWKEWKEMFVSYMDGHAPRKLKRTRPRGGFRCCFKLDSSYQDSKIAEIFASLRHIYLLI